MAYDDLYNEYEQQPYADFGMPGSTVREVQPNATAAPLGTQGQADFTQQHTDETAAGYSPYADQNWSQVQQQLQQEAQSRGLAYDPNDLADVQRAYYNSGPTGGMGGNLSSALGIETGKYDSRLLYDGTSVGDRNQGGATANSGGWFGSNAPSGSGFPSNIYPSAFGEQYTTLDRPSWLTGPYTPPTWGGFTAADLYADPGYQTRLDASQRSFERGAAAQGSILSGGSVDALGKRQQDFAANEYGNAYARKYGAFIDQANLGQQGRLINENAYQSDVGNNRNAYATRYQAYLDQIMNRRNAEGDYWQRLQDQAQNSLTAAGLARP